LLVSCNVVEGTMVFIKRIHQANPAAE